MNTTTEMRTAQVVPLASLVPAAWNANRVPEDVLRKIRRSIEEFGFVENLVARPHPSEKGKLEVLSGNHRLLLLTEMGAAEVPVVVVDLTDADARILAQALNRTRGDDDPEAYARLLESVLAEVDYGRVVEFLPETESSIDRLLREFSPASLVDPDDVPPLPAEPRSRLGEVYELGSHRLMCGDATDPSSYELLMGHAVARVVFTDPPYGVEYTGGSKPREALVDDGRGTDIYMKALPIIAEWAASDASFYIWYADLSIAAAAAAAAGLRVRCQIIWLKNQAQFFNNARYHGKHEPCIYAAKSSGTAAWFGPTNETTVWEEARARANDFHPTQKPVALAQRALINSSERGDSVLDPFAGSGSTLIAAEMTGRHCFAIEIDPAYCDVIRERYERFTLGKAA